MCTKQSELPHGYTLLTFLVNRVRRFFNFFVVKSSLSTDALHMEAIFAHLLFPQHLTGAGRPLACSFFEVVRSCVDVGEGRGGMRIENENESESESESAPRGSHEGRNATKFHLLQLRSINSLLLATM